MIKYGKNLGLFINGRQGEFHYGPLMAQFRGIDALVQPRVIGTRNSPPETPTDGDMYIVGPNAFGEFAGKAGNIARWTSDVVSPQWEYYEPREGWTTWVQEELTRQEYRLGTWLPTNASNVPGVVVIQGDGSSDRSAQLAAANNAGLPIQIVGVLVIGTPTTISVPIVDTLAQIFSPSSKVTIANALPVRPEWWGMTAGNIRRAVDALPATGGEILMRPVTYPNSYDTIVAGQGTPGVDYLNKPGVTIRASLPSWNVARDGFVAGSGTIIEGMFAVFANGFRIIGGFGVDTTAAVCAKLYNGAVKDSFIHFQPNKNAPTYARDVHIDAVYGVGADTTTGTHGVLIEAIDGGYVGRAEAGKSNHGVVIKAKKIKAGSLVGWSCGGENVIVKSDDYANATDIQIQSIRSYGLGRGSTNFGVLLQALGGGLGQVQIDSIIEDGGCATGLQISRGTNTGAGDIQIGKYTSDGATTAYRLDGALRTCIDQIIVNNCVTPVEVTPGTVSRSNRIGTIAMTNVSGNGFQLSGWLRVGSVAAENVANVLYNFVTTDGRIFVEGADTLNNVRVYWSATGPFANGWAPFGAGNSAYELRLAGGRVNLKGLIRNGTAAQFGSVTSQVTPGENYRCVGMAYNGSTYSAAEVVIGTNGSLAVSNYAAGSAYVSLDGVSWPIPF